MQVQQLEYLVALAREQHFGRAASACHVTQPTLSAGIRRLEQGLGVPLVLRGSRFMGLTPEGERTVLWARRILADVTTLRRDVGTVPSGGPAGRLRVGAIPTSLPALAKYTAPLAISRPALGLRILSLTSRQIEAGLRDGDLDVGVTYLDNEPLRDVRSRGLYTERYLLLGHEVGPRERTIDWEQAAKEPLCLLTSDMQHRRIVDAAFAQAGVHPRAYLETNSITALFAHVRQGVYAGVVANTWIDLFGVPEGLRATPLREPEVTRQIGLVWPDRDPVSLVTQAFLNVVRA